MRRLRALFLAGLILAVAVIPASASTDTVATGEWASNDTGIIWINTQVGYLVFTNGPSTAADLVWTKTVDGGNNWTTPVTIQADNPTTTCQTAPALAVWYDQWTKGDSGSRIHIGWHHNSQSGGSCSNAGTNDNISYTYLDTANDVLGSTVSTLITAYGGQCGNPCILSMTKSQNGNLYIHAIPTTSSFQRRFLRSTDNGATFTTRSIGPGGGEIRTMLAPAVANPNFVIGSDDIWAWDTLTTTVMLYDNSIDVWSPIKDFSSSIIGANCAKCKTRSVDATVVTPTSGGISGEGVPGIFWGLMTDGTPSNPHDFYVIRHDIGVALGGATIDQGITLQTPVFTGITDVLNIGLTFDENHDVLYAWYQDFVADEIYYKTSDDYGDTWSAETRFDDSANQKLDLLTTPTFTRSGARLMPVWEETPDLVTNLGSASEITSEIPTDDQAAENKLQRFAAGLGFTGSGGRFAFAAIGAMLLTTILIFRAPVIVFLCLEMLWFGLMAVPGVEFVTPGVFITLLVVGGILMIFAILQKLVGDQTGGNLG